MGEGRNGCLSLDFELEMPRCDRRVSRRWERAIHVMEAGGVG